MEQIPIPRIKINLLEDEPSKVIPEQLGEELANIGLGCKLNNPENLKKYISETLDKFPDGTVQGYKIYSYNPGNITEFMQYGCTKKLLDEIVCDDDVIHANWRPIDTCPYMNQLAVIGFPEHFDKLQKDYNLFAGKKSDTHYTNKSDTVDVIKTQFVEIATNMSSTLVSDMDKALLEAALTKIIAPVDPSSVDYDSGLQNRSIFLINGYDPVTASCDAIGVLNVEYKLYIENYKEKKQSKKEYQLGVAVRTSLYNDITELENEVMFIQTQLKGKMFFRGNIPYPTQVEIFESLPPENNDTFIKSLPLEQTENHIMSVMVLYAPDLQNVGIIDNTNSDAATTYSKTITSGFTFAAGQKISAGAKFSAGTIFSKAELNVNLEISFTEQWNNSQSETIAFSVHKNAKAYLYQGLLNCALLEFNIKTGTYEYKEYGEFLTNLLRTSAEPINNTTPVLMKKNENENLPLWMTINQHD